MLVITPRTVGSGSGPCTIKVSNCTHEIPGSLMADHASDWRSTASRSALNEATSARRSRASTGSARSRPACTQASEWSIASARSLAAASMVRDGTP